MKKILYLFLLLVLAASILVLAPKKFETKTTNKLSDRPLTQKKKSKVLTNWEASPEAIAFKSWQLSPEGKKVLTSAAKIKNQITDYSDIEAIVSSLTLPVGSRLGFGIMVKIKGEDYILSFGIERDKSNEFLSLKNLKLQDKIIIKSRNISHAPKYAYPIINGDYVAKENKVIYKRKPVEGGC